MKQPKDACEICKAAADSIENLLRIIEAHPHPEGWFRHPRVEQMTQGPGELR